ncbi:MAG: carotenoid oxygenase family protein [Cyanobacteria bacterium J06621_11]
MTQSEFRFPRAFMSSSREELSNVSLTIRDGSQPDKSAVLPDDLQGHVFIISFAGTAASPPPDSVPDDAIPKATVMPGAGGQTALFNGDGIVYRIDFRHQSETRSESPLEDSSDCATVLPIAPGTAQLTSRLLKTPAFFADKITQEKEQYKEFRFIDVGLARLSSLGLCNQVNTALIPVKVSKQGSPRLLATNDVNRPFEIDPRTLKIVSPIGSLNPLNSTEKTVWSLVKAIPSVFEFLLSSAHPATAIAKTDASERGEIFTVSSIRTIQNLVFKPKNDRNPDGESKNFLIRWQIESDGTERLQRWEVVTRAEQSDNPEGSIKILQSTHMLGVTEKHIVIADTAMKTEQIESIFLLLLGVFFLFFRFAMLRGEERQQKRREIKEGIKILKKFIQLMRVKPKQALSPLSEIVFEELAAISEDSPLLRRPTRDAVDIIEKALENRQEISREIAVERGGSVLSLDDRLTDYLQNFPSQLQSFSTTEARSRSSRRGRKIVDRFIKRLRLRVVSKQDVNTSLYIVRRSDLDTPKALERQQVTAQKVVIAGAFAHFFTDYEETDAGEIVITAPLTDGQDPAEYVVQYDRPQLIKNGNISDLSGALPIGMESNVLALMRIKPQQDSASAALSAPDYELTFDKIKASKKYLNREIYQNFKDNPLYLGLYAYRDDSPKLTDLFIIEGGGFPEMITEFIHDLYKDLYKDHPSRRRRVSVQDLSNKVSKGIPVLLSHVKIERERKSEPLQVQQTYVFPPRHLIFSLQFIPRTNSSKDQGDKGYLLCSVVKSDQLYSNSADSSDSDWSDNSEIWIFDGQKLSDGPKYKLSHPRLNFGLTLHSTWLSQLVSAPPTSYSFEQDYGPAIKDFIARYLSTELSSDLAQERQRLENLFKEIGTAFEDYRQK